MKGKQFFCCPSYRAKSCQTLLDFTTMLKLSKGSEPTQITVVWKALIKLSDYNYDCSQSISSFITCSNSCRVAGHTITPWTVTQDLDKILGAWLKTINSYLCCGLSYFLHLGISFKTSLGPVKNLTRKQSKRINQMNYTFIKAV